MNTSITHPDVRSYLGAVRAHLSDIPEHDLDDLVEDLEGHLLEVAAEDDGSLEERLGPPEVYAEELRATAGLPSRDPGAQPLAKRFAEGFKRSTAWRMIEEAGGSTTVRFLREFIPQLRPGWWVLRGYLAVAALSIIWHEGYYLNPAVPHAAGGYAIGTVAALFAIIASVALGRASDTQQTMRRFSQLVSAAVVGVTLMAIPAIGDLYVQTEYVTDFSSPQGLYQEDGTPIANVCPYSSDGKPLAGVLLFDQDGRPITGTTQYDDDGLPVDRVLPSIRNAYPLELRKVDPVTGTVVAPLPCPTILTVPPANPSSGHSPGSGD
jgi:hypothetical protein